MALIVAGERSGVGKTTVTLALLAALCRSDAAQGFPLADEDHGVQSFKVGPDYIDPMFHRYVTGRPCRNLDPILTSEIYVQQCFGEHSQTAAYALVEGVMGLFDGASGREDIGSTAHIARLLDIPVVLVLDCRRLSRSVGAIALGYQSFDPRIQLAGLVLNQVGSDRHEQMLRQALEPLNLPIVGVIRRDQAVTLPDRHLGLIPTDELPELDRIVEQLAHLGRTCFDWDVLHPLLQTSRQSKANLTGQNSSTPETPALQISLNPANTARPRIAIARDRAFSFYYADNLDLLQDLGAELVEWSPMTDPVLPSDVSGLYFGGGFPEVFAATLADNQSARQAVKQAIAAGMPTYAECGGLMYLCETLIDFDHRPWPMVGTLPFTVHMGKRLTLGYRRAIAQHDSPLMRRGQEVWGHEFHRSSLSSSIHLSDSISSSDNLDTRSDHSQRAKTQRAKKILSLQNLTPPCSEPDRLSARSGEGQSTDQNDPLELYQLRGFDPNGSTFSEGWLWQNLHASYVHLHWGSCPELPAQFIRQGQIWANRLPKGTTPVEN
ncbi:MAG: cobyrinate a,c-diamide synthase [Elainellaceae cyanobacterium]